MRADRRQALGGRHLDASSPASSASPWCLLTPWISNPRWRNRVSWPHPTPESCRSDVAAQGKGNSGSPFQLRTDVRRDERPPGFRTGNASRYTPALSATFMTMNWENALSKTASGNGRESALPSTIRTCSAIPHREFNSRAASQNSCVRSTPVNEQLYRLLSNARDRRFHSHYLA